MTESPRKDKSSKRVLFVSLAFPPLPVVGVYRVAKFCKYLPEMGYKPYVLTERIRKTYEPDWGTLEDIGNGVAVTRTLNIQPLLWWDNRQSNGNSHNHTASGATAANGNQTSAPVSAPRFSPGQLARRALRRLRQTVSVPDARMAWIPQGLLPGLRLIFREKIDVIMSSSPAVTNHLMAYLLSRLSGRPYVIDYRDLWTMSGAYGRHNLPPALQSWDRACERLILKHCRGVVVATNTFKKNMVAGFSDINIGDKITVIYNGVDAADYTDAGDTVPRNAHFTISYFGNLYGFRDPSQFIEALVKWAEMNPAVKNLVRVDFWGSHVDRYVKNVLDHHLDDIVTFQARIPQREALRKMLETDLLLLIQGIDPRAGDAIPTKLFEYIATGKPILGFFPPGEAADLLAGHGDHLVVSHPDAADIDRIVSFLERHLRAWQNSAATRDVRIDFPPEFSRRHQAAQLAEFLDRILQIPG